MQFDTLAEFLDMGGYAFFVWLALIIHSLSQKKKVLIEISKKIIREERLKESRGKKS
jgi:heme exporter protein D